MDEKLNALDKLIEAVEEGTHNRDLYDLAVAAGMDEDSVDNICAANDGSLDAALALHEALLPGWRARLDIGRRNRCWMISPENRKLDAYSSTPARAWLLAILRAYRSVQS